MYFFNMDWCKHVRGDVKCNNGEYFQKKIEIENKGIKYYLEGKDLKW